jgi:undecaprenyl-phosphate alpha-N-acetylglucosaminyl 1-phosphatetransferase
MAVFLSTLLVTIAGIYILQPAASHFGLVDRPGGRKQHLVHTPLIGGITIGLSLLFFLVLFPFEQFGVGVDDGWAFPATVALILLIGIADDFLELGVRVRFLLHALVALAMIHWGGVLLADLGYLLGPNLLELGLFAVPLTVFATLGTINALNMVDGVDGLAGVLSSVTVAGIALLTFVAGEWHCLWLTIAILGALSGFLIFNFPYRARTHAVVFLGDAGSNLLGFILAWLLINLSQGADPVIAPVTALWLFAIPLIDTVAVMVRRVWMKRSPFKADRGHLHHLMIDAGFRVRQVVQIMAALQLAMATIGIWMLWTGVEEVVGFTLFLIVFTGHLLFVSRPWRAVPLLRCLHRACNLTVAGSRSVFVGNLSPEQAESTLLALLGDEAYARGYVLYGYRARISGDERVGVEIECWSVTDMHWLIKRLARRASETEPLEIRQFIPRQSKHDRRVSNDTAATCRRKACRRHSAILSNHAGELRYYRYPEVGFRSCSTTTGTASEQRGAP